MNFSIIWTTSYSSYCYDSKTFHKLTYFIFSIKSYNLLNFHHNEALSKLWVFLWKMVVHYTKKYDWFYYHLNDIYCIVMTVKNISSTSLSYLSIYTKYPLVCLMLMAMVFKKKSWIFIYILMAIIDIRQNMWYNMWSNHEISSAWWILKLWCISSYSKYCYDGKTFHQLTFLIFIS